MKMTRLTMIWGKKVFTSSKPAIVLLSRPNTCSSNICLINMCSFLFSQKSQFPIKQERILLGRILRLRRVAQATASIPLQCDPKRSFLFHRKVISYEIKNAFGPLLPNAFLLINKVFHMPLSSNNMIFLIKLTEILLIL